ncbi:hypothetical protein LINPERHAP1_LOCUS7874 [Linum perenne]
MVIVGFNFQMLSFVFSRVLLRKRDQIACTHLLPCRTVSRQTRMHLRMLQEKRKR